MGSPDCFNSLEMHSPEIVKFSNKVHNPTHHSAILPSQGSMTYGFNMHVDGEKQKIHRVSATRSTPCSAADAEVHVGSVIVASGFWQKLTQFWQFSSERICDMMHLDEGMNFGCL